MCIIGWFLFGVILAEIINNLDLLELRFNVFFVAIPLPLAFLFHELVMKPLEHKVNSSGNGEAKYLKIISIYHLFLWMLGICLLLSIPFQWWEMIKKLAILANEGKKIF